MPAYKTLRSTRRSGAFFDIGFLSAYRVTGQNGAFFDVTPPRPSHDVVLRCTARDGKSKDVTVYFKVDIEIPDNPGNPW